MRLRFLPVFFVLLAASAAIAQDKFDAAAGAKALAPFVTQRTLFVAHVDLANVDMAAVEKRGAEVLKAAVPDPKEQADEMAKMTQGLAIARTWLSDFSKAGGRHIYVVGSLPDFPRRAPLVIVPMADPSKAGELFGLLLTGKPQAPEAGATRGMASVVVGNSMVLCDEAQADRVKTIEPQAQPAVEKGFAAAGDSTGQAVFIVTDETRKFLGAFMPPTLPPQLGGGSSAVLTDGVQFIAAGVTPPPSQALAITIQAKDAEAAKALGELADRAMEALKADKAMASAIPGLAWADVLPILKPTVAGDHLTIKMNSDQVNTLVDKVMIPVVARARVQAQAAMSMSNMRQILMACIMYSNDHKGVWPDQIDLATLKEYGIDERTFTNPRQVQRKDGYVYVKPAKDPKNAAEAMVIYEAFDQFGMGVSVGFADGHVEPITDKAQFDKLLKAAKGE